jgi:hypothetical protein
VRQQQEGQKDKHKATVKKGRRKSIRPLLGLTKAITKSWIDPQDTTIPARVQAG